MQLHLGIFHIHTLNNMQNLDLMNSALYRNLYNLQLLLYLYIYQVDMVYNQYYLRLHTYQLGMLKALELLCHEAAGLAGPIADGENL